MPEVEPVEPGISLVGTVVASDPQWSRASLSTGPERSSTRVYRIGDQLPDQSTLVAIRADRVVLDQAGERRVLLLQERDPAPAKTSEPEKKNSDQPQPLVRPAGRDRYRMDRRQLDELLDKSEEILRDARLTLAFGSDGGVQGLRLSLLNTNTVFEQIGLVEGDQIHRIGSLVIDHPEKIEQVPELLQNARELDVELTRDGEMKILRYFID